MFSRSEICYRNNIVVTKYYILVFNKKGDVEDEGINSMGKI